MSFLDDHYEDMLIETSMISKSIEQYAKEYSPQRVVDDAISSFKEDGVDEEDSVEVFSRDILKTIARTKFVSVKQKACLVKLLVLRGEDGYEADYGF